MQNDKLSPAASMLIMVTAKKMGYTTFPGDWLILTATNERPSGDEIGQF